jgi:hypothetical protein
VVWTPPACRSATSRYSELNTVVACFQAATPLINFRAPPEHLPVSLPLSARQVLPARTGDQQHASQQPKSVCCLAAHKEPRYPNSGSTNPAGVRQAFLHLRRTVPRNPHSKTQTWAFPQFRPDFFHPGGTHRLHTYRALIPLEIGNALPRPHPSVPLQPTLRWTDRLRRVHPSKER